MEFHTDRGVAQYWDDVGGVLFGLSANDDNI